MSTTPSKFDDIIDSRDIIERIKELEVERDDYDPSVGGSWQDTHQDDAEELAILIALQDEASGYSPDWTYGSTLVRDSYFETYAQELADDLGLTRDNESWPYTCVDWERATAELRQDYTCISFDGVDYWIR